MPKILWHERKVSDFLQGKKIFPVTLELGLTTACNRACNDCPSALGEAGQHLPVERAEALIRFLSGESRGVIFTGGEPTLHPDLGRILLAAHEHGFIDRVLISNGLTLEREEVWQPLLDYATMVRISLYDWSQGSMAGVEATFKRIARLRERIAKRGSRLQIGTSALVHENNHHLAHALASSARRQGADWIYFHPTCIRPLPQVPELRGQRGVWETLNRCRGLFGSDFSVHFIAERFSGATPVFSGYHAAHFILVVGADGRNYLGSESKFQERFELADFSTSWPDDILWHEERLEKIAAVISTEYPPIGSRNRGTLYSDLLDKLKLRETGSEIHPESEYLQPHII